MTAGNFIRYARTQAVTTKSDAFALTAKQDVCCTPYVLKTSTGLVSTITAQEIPAGKETYHVDHHHHIAIRDLFTS
jgi:hypothetical protein